MSQPQVNPPSARNWRDLPQAISPRVRSRVAKKRMAFAVGNVLGLALVLGAVGWGIYEVATTLANDPARITATTSSVPLRDIVLRTDGVLDKAWVTRTLRLSTGAKLMDLNLDALQNRLLATGQVASAVVTRQFPSSLIVTLQERSPVARIMARDGSAAPHAYLVARDGSVYDGSGYENRLVTSMPFLAGVKLVREGDRFAPIDGMSQVAALLATARTSARDIYRTIRVVSLANLATDGTITVKSTEADEIIFGAASDGYYRQLARLDYILSQTRLQNPPQSIKSINLAIGGEQVPVAFNPSSSDSSLAAPASRSASLPVSTAFFPLPTSSSL